MPRVFLPHLIQYNILSFFFFFVLFFACSYVVKESKANSTLAVHISHIWNNLETNSTMDASWGTHSAGRKKSRETDRRPLQAGKQVAFSFFPSLSLSLTVHQHLCCPHSFHILSLLSLTLIHLSLSLRCKSSLSSSTSAAAVRRR